MSHESVINFLQHLAAFLILAVDVTCMFQVVEFKPPKEPGAPKLGRIPEMK